MKRQDNRSIAQFRKDIKECTSIELSLMREYVKFLNESKDRGDRPYFFEDHGVDNTGAFIANERMVNCKADFLLKRSGQNDRKIEIKFCRDEKSVFHLKIHQIKKYIQDDVCIVNWMGIDTQNRKFCILTPAILKESLDSGKKINFWQKPCIQYKCEDYKWYKI